MQSAGTGGYPQGGVPPPPPAPVPPAFGPPPGQPPYPYPYPYPYAPRALTHDPSAGYSLLSKIFWVLVVYYLLAAAGMGGTSLFMRDLEENEGPPMEDDEPIDEGIFESIMVGLCLVAIVIFIVFIAILVAAIIGLVRVSRAANYLGGEIAEKTKIAIIIIIVGAVLRMFGGGIGSIALSVGFFMLVWPLLADGSRSWALVYLVGAILFGLLPLVLFAGIILYGPEVDDPFIFFYIQVLVSLLGAIVNGIYAVLVQQAGEQMDALVAERGPAPAPPPPYGVPLHYGGGPPPPFPPPG